MDDAHAEKFFESLEESIADGSFVKLTLAKCRGRDAYLKNLYVRPVALKKGARLSFLFRHKTKDVVKNHTAEEGVRLIHELLGAEFRSAHLFTTAQDLQLDPREYAPGRIPLAAFALDGSMHHERGLPGELFHRERLHLDCPRRG